MDEDQTLLANGRISKSSWFIYHKYKFLAGFGVLAVILPCVIVLGLIPLYISSSSSSDSNSATASQQTNNFTSGWSRLDTESSSDKNAARSMLIGNNKFINENGTNKELMLACGGKRYKMDKFMQKGFGKMRDEDKIGKALKGPKAKFSCKNGKINEVLSYSVESGNETFDKSLIDGYFLNSTNLIDFSRVFREGETDITLARALKQDRTSEETTISGKAYNAETGMLMTYSGCKYDSSGNAANIADCLVMECVDESLCTPTAKNETTGSTKEPVSESQKISTEKSITEETEKSASEPEPKTTTKENEPATTTKEFPPDFTRKELTTTPKTFTKKSTKKPKEKERDGLKPREYDIISELVEHTYVMELGYTDTFVEVVTHLDENADAEMSQNRETADSVEEMIV